MILAARSRNTEDTPWVQLLVFLVFIVIAAMRGLSRAKTTFKSEDDQNIEDALAQKNRQFRPPGNPIYQAAAQEPPAKQERLISQSYGPRQTKAYEPLQPKPQFQSNIKDSAQHITSDLTTKPADRPPVSFSTSIVKSGNNILEPLLYSADPDEIKRAVLYYEILGKPLSLRDSQDSSTVID